MLISTIARRIAGRLPIFSGQLRPRLYFTSERCCRRRLACSDRRRRFSRRVARHAGRSAPQSVSAPWARPVLESTGKLFLRRDGQGGGACSGPPQGGGACPGPRQIIRSPHDGHGAQRNAAPPARAAAGPHCGGRPWRAASAEGVGAEPHGHLPDSDTLRAPCRIS